MSDALIVAIILALVGIAGSAIASGAETGLYALNRVRLAVRAGRRDPRAVGLRAELEHPDRVLSTLLLVNNIANYMGSFGVAAILSGFGFGPIGVVFLNTLIVVPLLFVFGETLPKDLFRTHADRWLYPLATPMRWTRWSLTICGLVPAVTMVGRAAARAFGTASGIDQAPRSRMAALLRESVMAGGMTSDQATLADRALAMDRLTVAQEMTPWRSVVRIAQTDGAKGLAKAASRTERSRLPVVGADGAVVGTISVIQTLLNPEASIEELLKPVPTITASTRVLDALHDLRTDRRPMAIVVDDQTPEQRPIGVVTLKDLVEPLMGDLRAW